jgi:hypothetical protein
MKSMGSTFGKRTQKLALAKTVTSQTLPPYEIEQKNETSTLLRLDSSLISLKILPLQITSTPENSIKVEQSLSQMPAKI